MRGAEFRGVSYEEVENGQAFKNSSGQDCARNHSLFAYPLEDNFEGVKYPLSWIKTFQERGFNVVVDAAAYAPTNRFSLTQHGVDFFVFSYYKMFGHPTGIGAFIAKKSILGNNLRGNEDPRKVTTYFGGGSALFGSPFEDFCSYRKKSQAIPLEDGTQAFLAAAALQHGFVALADLGMDNIRGHVNALTEYLYQGLKDLKLSNGQPAVEIYGLHGTAPRVPKVNERGQGSIITFNLRNESGGYHGYVETMHLAMKSNIHLRGGCMCNPGACVLAVSKNIDQDKVTSLLKERGSCDDMSDFVDGHPVGAIRASIGAYVTKNDVDLLLDFLKVKVIQTDGDLRESEQRIHAQHAKLANSPDRDAFDPGGPLHEAHKTFEPTPSYDRGGRQAGVQWNEHLEKVVPKWRDHWRKQRETAPVSTDGKPRDGYKPYSHQDQDQDQEHSDSELPHPEHDEHDGEHEEHERQKKHEQHEEHDHDDDSDHEHDSQPDEM